MKTPHHQETKSVTLFSEEENTQCGSPERLNTKKSILSCKRISELVLPAEGRAPVKGFFARRGGGVKPVVKAGVEQMAAGCVLSDASLAAINS